jgi:hypothetical protein
MEVEMQWQRLGHTAGTWHAGDHRRGPYATIAPYISMMARDPLKDRRRYKAHAYGRGIDGGWWDTWAVLGSVQAARRWAEKTLDRRHHEAAA